MKDQISALMDDEFDDSGSDHLFTAVQADGELAECWSTYHLIGDAMRGQAFLQSDFKHRLMHRLDTEPTVLAPKSSRKKSPVLWSVAASVAAVMFVGWMMLQQQTQQSNELAPVEIAQNIPSEYLLAHRASSANAAAYYIEPAAFSESEK